MDRKILAVHGAKVGKCKVASGKYGGYQAMSSIQSYLTMFVKAQNPGTAPADEAECFGQQKSRLSRIGFPLVAGTGLEPATSGL